MIISGKLLAEEIKQEIAQNIKQKNIKPVLAVVLVGENEASRIYVNNKKKIAMEVGMECLVHHLPKETREEDVSDIVKMLNDDNNVNGIIVQLPLPREMDSHKIISLISPEKDVDGLGTYNAGLLLMGDKRAITAATPRGVLHMLNSTGVSLQGKNALVIGRSNIVGKPMMSLLLNSDCTVTVAHSKTLDLQNMCKQYDIVIVACGVPNLVKKDWIKKGAIVIDVGINRLPDSKLCGDVDFVGVSEVASYISPVPGGVGPMTVVMLIQNTYEAFLRQNNVS